ncbi:TMEM175 family protein [Peribacillus butanolivorans]|uniref:TMEM175 family protein n=1 Tax=Peribacillus butanolivorans TaxID=421767 RepID=UPI0036B08E26
MYPSERTVTYVDAIFAITLTLLVIDIKIPEPIRGGNLIEILSNEGTSFISFLISFVAISVYWFNHHTMFHYIKKIDHTLIFLNMALMLDVIVIPFCASILGQYIDVGGWDSKVAALIYGGWILLGAIPFNLVWGYVLKHKELLHEDFDVDDLVIMKNYFNRGVYIYLIVTLLSLWNVWISVIGFALLLVLYLLPAKHWIWIRNRIKPNTPRVIDSYYTFSAINLMMFF